MNATREKTVNVPMYRVENDAAPFVEAAIMDKDAVEHCGLFLLDSGCTYNLISAEIYHLFGEMCRKNKGKSTSITIGDKPIDEENLDIHFVLGGIQFHENFTMSPGFSLGKVEDIQIFGILGIDFLQQHSLAIDFVSHSLHTTDVSHVNLCIEDCEYFFPMEIGFKHFSAPVIPLKSTNTKSGNTNFVAMVDTGSSINVLAEGSLKQSGIEVELSKEKSCLTCASGKLHTQCGLAKFTMLGLPYVENQMKEFPRTDSIEVASMDVLLTGIPQSDSENSEIPTVDVILGSPFISKEGWTLDFGAQIIFKRKDITQQMV